MTFIGKFHPLLVHFPIALVLAGRRRARGHRHDSSGMAHRRCPNIRAGAVLGVVTAITGWLLASSTLAEAGPSLEWHRWVGTAGAAGAIGAALLSWRLDVLSRRSAFVYRFTLFVTALLVAITGHLGGALGWGAGFLQR